jgi:2-keto-4-pentenoate hydratase/2-oxohepta-3-ene-1,7-dioic acid hydratase in catechol pathway
MYTPYQNSAKDKGLPWTIAKGFDTALPHGNFIPKDKVKDPHALTLWCKVSQCAHASALLRLSVSMSVCLSVCLHTHGIETRLYQQASTWLQV